MKFKKFKHDLQKDNLIIPSMSDALKTYSEHKKYFYKKETKQSRLIFPILKRTVVMLTILVMAITSTIILISHENLGFTGPQGSQGPQGEQGNTKFAYPLDTVRDETKLKWILDFERDGYMDHDYNPNSTSNKGDKGDASSSGDLFSESTSQTNLQEKNVDEADIVKADNDNIYYINLKNCKLYQYNIDKKTLNSIILDGYVLGQKQEPQLYIYQKYIIVIQQHLSGEKVKNENFVSINIYDKETLTLQKSFASIGTSIDSRITNGTLYFIYYKSITDELPSYTIDNEEYTYEYSDIHYSQAIANYQYTVICAINLTNLEFNSYIQLGTKNWITVYVTEKSLYLVYSGFSNYINKYAIDGSPFEDGYQSTIFRFAINKTNIEYNGLIVTSGLIKNQFYLDEYGGYLRVVLEQQNISETKQNKLEIYDLSQYNGDKILQVASIRKGIGYEGEEIESVKFSDNSCLIVTYLRRINRDPLYYIDLTNQLNPQIIGGYKEPGYNSYLHYLSDDLAIGFGTIGDILEFAIKDDFLYFLKSKMGLYEIKNGVPNKVEEVLFFSTDVMSNHKVLYIENDIFGYTYENYKLGWSSPEELTESCYAIYTVVYEAKQPKLKLLKQFASTDNTYERMIRVEDKYYLISEKYIETLDQNFEIIDSVEMIE